MTSREFDYKGDVIFSWHDVGERPRLVAYRRDGKGLIWPFIRYMLYVSALPYLNAKTVRDEAFKLRATFEHLRDADVQTISDEWIQKFRSSELQRVLAKPNSRGNSGTAKRTVNAKLRVLYNFVVWYQWSHPGIAALVGPKAQITLNIEQQKIPEYINRTINGHSRPRLPDKDLPLLYKDAGEHPLNRRTRAATEKNFDAMQAYFLAQHTEYAALRDILIMKIANVSGMRRGSINSLRCAQFSEEHLLSMKDTLRVVADEQKLDYDNVVEFPRFLALDVASFIAGPRADLLVEMGWDKKRTKDRIFISARNGEPLKDQTLSDIFGKAARAVGISPGHALHMFRFKHVDDLIVEEIETRLALNLDTSSESVAAAVAIQLGWKNVETLKLYVSRTQTQLLRRARAIRGNTLI